MQPTLAVVEALLHEDPTSSIYIASGLSFKNRFNSFISSLSLSSSSSPVLLPYENRIFRIDLGITDDVEDYSKNMLKQNNEKKPELFQSHRHERGNPIPFFDYWNAFAAGSEYDRLSTVNRILGIIGKVKPDMVIVDQIYGTPFDGESFALPHFCLR